MDNITLTTDKGVILLDIYNMALVEPGPDPGHTTIHLYRPSEERFVFESILQVQSKIAVAKASSTNQ